MNNKLEIARVEEQDKVTFATHYLEGPASIWWNHQRHMRNNETTLTWEEFEEAFRKAPISDDLIKIRQQEFLALTQGNLNVGEYLTQFNNLSRYAPEEVNTDDNKKDRFLRGMHQTPKTQLSVLQFLNFQALTNTALIAEKEHRSIPDSHEGSFESYQDHHEGTSSEPHTWPPNPQISAPPVTRSQPREQGYPQEEPRNRCSMMQDGKGENFCFKCSETRHHIADCSLRNNNGHHNRSPNNSTAGAIKPPQVGRVHHLSAKEANEDLGIMMGMC